jgi:hypothetical protein
MPASQRGETVRLGGGWGVRYYDENGTRRRQGGFATKSAAREWLDSKVDEIVALRRGDPSALRRRELPTLAELVEEFLHQHNAEPNTLRTLKARLRYATEGPKLDGQGGFGELRIDRLEPRMMGAWRKRLPERSAHAITKALRQVLHYAVRAKLVDENVAVAVPNPEPKRREIPAFSSLGSSRQSAASFSRNARPCRSSSVSPACALRSGSRSRGATSTAALASSAFAASTRTGR